MRERDDQPALPDDFFRGWLSITRMEGESFRVGEDIFITVIRGRSGKVRLAIRAPKSERICRLKLPRIQDDMGQEDPTP